MLNADFPAETANKRPSLVDILSGPAPRSPVRAARFDASPHIILTWAYLRLLKFLLSEAKRLFQQYRSLADITARSRHVCTARSRHVCFTPKSGHENGYSFRRRPLIGLRFSSLAPFCPQSYPRLDGRLTRAA